MGACCDIDEFMQEQGWLRSRIKRWDLVKSGQHEDICSERRFVANVPKEACCFLVHLSNLLTFAYHSLYSFSCPCIRIISICNTSNQSGLVLIRIAICLGDSFCFVTLEGF